MNLGRLVSESRLYTSPRCCFLLPSFFFRLKLTVSFSQRNILSFLLNFDFEWNAQEDWRQIWALGAPCGFTLSYMSLHSFLLTLTLVSLVAWGVGVLLCKGQFVSSSNDRDKDFVLSPCSPHLTHVAPQYPNRVGLVWSSLHSDAEFVREDNRISEFAFTSQTCRKWEVLSLSSDTGF